MTTVTTAGLYTEPTADELRQHLIDKRIGPKDVWLAALLGSKSAQAVAECTGLERLLLAIDPRVLGPFLLDFTDRVGRSHLALIIAKQLLPAWNKRFPNDDLGAQVVTSIARTTYFGTSEEEFHGLRAQLDYEHGHPRESYLLSTMLQLAHIGAEFHFNYAMRVLDMTAAQLIDLLAKGLIPWLLTRQPIESV